MKESNQIKSFVEPVGMNGSNIILKMRCFLCLLWLSLPPEMGDTFSLFFRFHSFSAFVSVPLLTPLNVAILIKLHCSFVSFLSPDFCSYLHRKKGEMLITKIAYKCQINHSKHTSKRKLNDCILLNCLLFFLGGGW